MLLKQTQQYLIRFKEQRMLFVQLSPRQLISFVQLILRTNTSYHCSCDFFVNENVHEECNGFRSRRWCSHGFEFSLRIPRSRSGNLYPVLLGLIRSESEERQSCSIFLASKVLPGEISELIYKQIIETRGYFILVYY